MNRRKIVTALLATLLVGLVALPGALAASPREIYADFADNGRLDKRYSAADLRQALQDAEAQGYPGAGVSPTRAAIQQQLGQQAAGSQGSPTGVGSVGSGGTLPFTGVDLALLTAGAALLLLVGLGFRRLGSRPRS